MFASPSIRSSLLTWLLLVVGGLLLAWMTDRLEPHFVPDSPSYLDYSFESLDAISRSQRTPGYPAWLRLVTAALGITMVPAAQVIVHATAVCMLLCALRSWGLPPIQRVAAAMAVAIGCTPMDHINTISTDAIAASVGVMVAAALLRWAGVGASWKYALVIAALATLAIFLRPAYLFLIPWLFVAGAMLQIVRGIRWSAATKRSLTLPALTIIPVVAWMCMRLMVVGDFGMLPFGHQNLAGVLVQLVSDEELRGVDGDAADLANAVVDQKERFRSTGPGFAPGEAGATMTIDARWDDMTYHVVVPAAVSVAGDDNVANHQAIAELNLTILSRWPRRYVVWLAKAARRGAWAIAADIVMHPVFLAAIMLALLAVLFRATCGTFPPPVPPSIGLRALAIIAVTYMLAKVGFVILTSPPVGRFSDAAAIFLPAWLAAMFLQRWIGQPVTPPQHTPPQHTPSVHGQS